MSISKLLFGEIALKKKLVTKDQVEECLEIQKRLKEMGINKTLGAIMHDKKYLSMVEIKEILREMTGTKDWNAIEGYEILGKLGKGGMGSVYKARHTRLDKLVALKVLPPELAGDQEYLDRFMREAHAAAKLNHPHIVQALDVGESYGYHYFVMEYVEGRTVKEMIDEQGTLDELTSLRIIAQMAEALEHAWRNEIVHRDIKPSNIIVTRAGVAKLCDLGLAKTVDDDSTITQTGVIMGTPFYLSPEQARSEPLDCRSDIYSLGVTLFHMVTGQVPFTGNSAATILYKHIFLDPPNPKSLNPSLSDGTVKLLRRMLAKRKEDRFADPTELLAAVREVIAQLRPEAVTEQVRGDAEAHGALLASRAEASGASSGALARTVDLTSPHPSVAAAEAGAPPGQGSAAVTVGGRWSRSRLVAASFATLGLAATTALLAANVLLPVERPAAEAALDPVALLMPLDRPRPEVEAALRRGQELLQAHRYAEALAVIDQLPAEPPLEPAELGAVLRLREQVLLAAMRRPEELRRRHEAGEDVLAEVRALGLSALADELRRHEEWLGRQRPPAPMPER
ncbi:MAG: hypothetical protein KatS3mg102_1727 [Planctomycetota bacterium]|nr:MAG: hypothetical protein KatS3mg102_1727 [Planctomycetota bacterium]